MRINSFSLSFSKIIEKEDGSKCGYVELGYFFANSAVHIHFQGETGIRDSRSSGAYIKDIDDSCGILELVKSINLRDNEEEIVFDIVHMFMGKVEEFKEANKWNIC